MGRKRRLRTRQLAVIDDLFGERLEEDQILAKHGLRKSTFKRWLKDALFMERIEQEMVAERIRSQILMAQYSLVAAAKLVELTGAQKEETARKACMSIIAPAVDDGRGKGGEQKCEEDEEGGIDY